MLKKETERNNREKGYFEGFLNVRDDGRVGWGGSVTSENSIVEFLEKKELGVRLEMKGGKATWLDGIPAEPLN